MRVGSVDKVDRSTLAADCMEADFKKIESVLFEGTTGWFNNYRVREDLKLGI